MILCICNILEITKCLTWKTNQWLPGFSDGADGSRSEVDVVTKSQHEGSLWWWQSSILTAVVDVCIYTCDKIVYDEIHTRMRASQKEETWIRLVGGINVNVLVVILSDRFTTCCCAGQLGQSTRNPCVLFLTTVYEAEILSIKKERF